MSRNSRWLLVLILIVAFLVRFWDLKNSPVSLYWDEMDVGYQAYSILQTGKDYFGNLPGLTVRSFADFRAPLVVYTTVPFVAVLGLSNISVRLPAAIFGVVSIFLIFTLARMLFKSEKAGLLSAGLMVFVPWNFHYSRMAFEAALLLVFFLGGIIAFLRGVKSPKWFIFSGVMFGLTVFTYNTAKLFVPLIVLGMAALYIKKRQLKKDFLLAVAVFGLLFLLSLYATFYLGGGQRFAEISVVTDPQLASKTDFLRQLSATSYTDNRNTGMAVRNLDKIIYNKATLVLERVSQNYLKVFSTDFLFVSGDPNLRHSTGRFGEFFAIEAVTILFGFAFILFKLKEGDKNSLLVLLWIILAPLPAVITREGGTHATRLFFLFPALTLLSAQGLILIWKFLPAKINLAVILTFIFLYGFGTASFLNYYLGAYKLDSAKVFQYGFNQAVDKAVDNIASYDYVIIDDRRDSALMNYLFNTGYDPKAFQSQINGLQTKIAGSEGDKINNLIMMKPGVRDWQEIFYRNLITGKLLLIVSAEQLQEQSPEKVALKLTKNQKMLEVIYYKYDSPAFYVIESRPENN